jgi:hypothetical protein
MATKTVLPEFALRGLKMLSERDPELYDVSGRIKLTHLGSLQTDPPLAVIF